MGSIPAGGGGWNGSLTNTHARLEDNVLAAALKLEPVDFDDLQRSFILDEARVKSDLGRTTI